MHAAHLVPTFYPGELWKKFLAYLPRPFLSRKTGVNILARRTLRFPLSRRFPDFPVKMVLTLSRDDMIFLGEVFILFFFFGGGGGKSLLQEQTNPFEPLDT